MIRTFLRSKIHRATVTRVDVDYEGSLSLDEDLMKAAGLSPYERVEVYNVTNGERFSTYLIRGEKGSREVGVYGAAGRRAGVGDKIIIASYAALAEDEIGFFTPKIVVLDDGNRIKELR
ncbi:MAG: aspartate 1-decarboxylase [Candidatus Aminicenantales bacterium]|jgi:aspartate 1-decarboxylase